MQNAHPAGRPHRNHGLFSDHYLNVTLPARPDWKGLASEAGQAMEEIAALLDPGSSAGFVLIVSGNLAFLNWLTIVLAISCFDDGILARFIPVKAAALAPIAVPHQVALGILNAE